jgi:class 3 adenylate cyclase
VVISFAAIRNHDLTKRQVACEQRIQGLAVSHAIFASKPVIDYPQSSALLQNAGIAPRPQSAALKGIAGQVPVYEIP